MVKNQGPTAGPNRQPSENIFSDDEDETKFIADVVRIKEEAWNSSKMKWNTIHGIPWKRCDLLGRGTFGSVFLGMREDLKLFAVKSVNIVYPPTPKSQISIKCQIAEIKMMKFMRCKYIVRCLGCGRSFGENGLHGEETLDVFLEYIARGSLKFVLKTRKSAFEETPYVTQYTYDLLKALQYMTKHGIVHGDIKSGNLLLGEDCVKLADWGGSKQLTKKNLDKILTGTFGFRPPEVIKAEEQGHPSDIFSLGCTVIELILGYSPKEAMLKAKNRLALNRFEPEDYCPEIPKNVSPECKDFLQQCLHSKAEDRWTAAELLNHPFITDRDKTNRLPYSMILPDRVEFCLLQPPRRNHPELPDEPMTKRVRRHLAGYPQSRVPKLVGRTPQEVPPSASSSYKATSSSSDSAHPLPLFSPDVIIEEDTNLHNVLVQALCEEGGAVQKKYPSLPKAPAKGAIRADLGPNIKDPNDKSLHVHFDPHVRVKEFKDSLVLSTSLMDALNDDIYQEAKRAYKEPLPEDEDEQQDLSRSLFPNDPLVARNRSGRPFLTSSAGVDIACSSLRHSLSPNCASTGADRPPPTGSCFSGWFDLCTSKKAVDALAPGTKPKPQKKKKK